MSCLWTFDDQEWNFMTLKWCVWVLNEQGVELQWLIFWQYLELPKKHISEYVCEDASREI